jgi:hypothetical protein
VRSFDPSTAGVRIGTNTVGATTANVSDGIHVQILVGTPTIGLDVTGNTCAAGDDILRDHDAGTFNIFNIVGAAPFTVAQVDTHLAGIGMAAVTVTGSLVDSYPK